MQCLLQLGGGEGLQPGPPHSSHVIPTNHQFSRKAWLERPGSMAAPGPVSICGLGAGGDVQCLGCPLGGVPQGWALLTASRPWAVSWAPPRDSEGPALRVGRNIQETLAGGLQAKQVVAGNFCVG